MVDYEKMWEELKTIVEDSHKACKEESFTNFNYAIREDAMYGVKMAMDSLEYKHKSLDGDLLDRRD